MRLMNRYAIELGQPAGVRLDRLPLAGGPAACNNALASLYGNGQWLRAMARVVLCQVDELLAKPGYRRRWLRIERERRGTMKQLQCLNNAELKDIGVNRADIPRIAHMLCVHAIDPRRTSL